MNVLGLTIHTLPETNSFCFDNDLFYHFVILQGGCEEHVLPEEARGDARAELCRGQHRRRGRHQPGAQFNRNFLSAQNTLKHV